MTRWRARGLVISLGQRPMQILVAERSLGEAPIIVLRERGKERIAGLNARDTGQAHLLDKPNLQCPVRALDPAFGLGIVGANDVDVEFVQSSAKLRHAIAASRAGLVDTEGRMLVRVKRHRLAIALQIRPRSDKIIERRLRLHETQMHQPTGRVINENQKGALRASVLEPPMLRSINLDQLADAFSPVSGLVNGLEPLPTVLPYPIGEHPAPNGLH